MGFPGLTYRTLVATNLRQATIDWTPMATNRCDSLTGQFTFTHTLNPAAPHLFFRVEARSD